MAPNTTLRAAVFKGGSYLLMRHIISIALKLIGVLVITRLIHPAEYASYISAANIYQYVIVLGELGVGVFLLRQPGEVSEQTFGTAYTLLLSIAVGMIIVVELAAATLADWINVPGFAAALSLIVFAIPFHLLAVPATVRLERALDYRSVALVEFVGQLVYYALAIPLVLGGYGAISLVISFLVQEFAVFVLAHTAARRTPVIAWDRRTATTMLRYSISFSAGTWIWQLRLLVNPFIIGHYVGAGAVGVVGMTIGLLDMLTIIRVIAWRISVAVLARFQTDMGKLREAVTEGIQLQALAVGSILLGFAWAGHVIVPLLFGERWAPVMDVYPYLAVSYLTQALFGMHTSALSVLQKNGQIAVFHLVHIALFAIAVSLLAPAYGIVGYGLGELVALSSYVLVHRFLVRAIGSPDYQLPALWWTGLVIGMFWRQIGPWAIAVPFLVLLWPASVRRVIFFLDRAWKHL